MQYVNVDEKFIRKYNNKNSGRVSYDFAVDKEVVNRVLKQLLSIKQDLIELPNTVYCKDDIVVGTKTCLDRGYNNYFKVVKSRKFDRENFINKLYNAITLLESKGITLGNIKKRDIYFKGSNIKIINIGQFKLINSLINRIETLNSYIDLVIKLYYGDNISVRTLLNNDDIVSELSIDCIEYLENVINYEFEVLEENHLQYINEMINETNKEKILSIIKHES